MSQPRSLLSTAALLVLVWACPAQATVVRSENPEPFQTWANESLMPAPREVIVDFGAKQGARFSPPRTIHWYDYYPETVSEEMRVLFLHEIGHAFDFTRMNRHARRHYARIYGIRQYDAEHFADDYAACAVGQRVAHPRYPFRAPTARQHHRICTLIRRAGARYG